jgi:hypothetical protein
VRWVDDSVARYAVSEPGIGLENRRVVAGSPASAERVLRSADQRELRRRGHERGRPRRHTVFGQVVDQLILDRQHRHVRLDERAGTRVAGAEESQQLAVGPGLVDAIDQRAQHPRRVEVADCVGELRVPTETQHDPPLVDVRDRPVVPRVGQHRLDPVAHRGAGKGPSRHPIPGRALQREQPIHLGLPGHPVPGVRTILLG